MNTLQFKKIFRIFSLVMLVGVLIIFSVIMSKAQTVSGILIIGLFALGFVAVPLFMFIKVNKSIKLLQSGQPAKLII